MNTRRSKLIKSYRQLFGRLTFVLVIVFVLWMTAAFMEKEYLIGKLERIHAEKGDAWVCGVLNKEMNKEGFCLIAPEKLYQTKVVCSWMKMQIGTDEKPTWNFKTWLTMYNLRCYQV